MVDANPEEHWYDASGNVLPPSRWISSDEPEEDDTYYIWPLHWLVLQTMAALSEGR